MTRPTSVFYTTCLSLLALSSVVTCTSSRQLEDQGNYAFDVTSYSVQTGSCFRLKQINDNDDDGNAYFYNGAYRAQYTRYTSFYLCGNSKNNNNNNNNNNLANCKMFVTDLPTYLQMSVNFLQTYCTTCSESCRRRTTRQRMLNDGEQQDQQDEQEQKQYTATADCNTCSKQCKSLVSDSSSATSAINYLQCEKSYNDGDLQYYSAPQCGNPDLGQYAIIGQYYDEDCTIKLNNDEAGSKFGLSYSYGVFDTVMSSKINCASNEQYCYDLASSSINCDSSSNDNNNNNKDDNGSKLCRSAQQAAAVYTYYKKPFSKRFHIKAILIVLVILSTLVAFLSYTYYVRHNRDRSLSSKMLDDQQVDHTNSGGSGNNTHGTTNGDYKLSSADGTTASDLPVIN